MNNAVSKEGELVKVDPDNSDNLLLYQCLMILQWVIPQGKLKLTINMSFWL